MSDYNDYRKLTYEELEHQNKDLREINKNLRQQLDEIKKYYQSFDKFATTVYDPNKSIYKELEDKLALAENSKQTAIDELLETKVIPLNQQVVALKQQLTTAYDVNQGQRNRIRDLEIVRDNLNRMIDFAVGYISATQPHTNKHPMEVKRWLFEGIKENL